MGGSLVDGKRLGGVYLYTMLQLGVGEGGMDRSAASCVVGSTGRGGRGEDDGDGDGEVPTTRYSSVCRLVDL